MRTFFLFLSLTTLSAVSVAQVNAAYGVVVGLVVGYFGFKLACLLFLHKSVRKELGL